MEKDWKVFWFCLFGIPVQPRQAKTQQESLCSPDRLRRPSNCPSGALSGHLAPVSLPVCFCWVLNLGIFSSPLLPDVWKLWESFCLPLKMSLSCIPKLDRSSESSTTLTQELTGFCAISTFLSCLESISYLLKKQRPCLPSCFLCCNLGSDHLTKLSLLGTGEMV